MVGPENLQYQDFWFKPKGCYWQDFQNHKFYYSPPPSVLLMAILNLKITECFVLIVLIKATLNRSLYCHIASRKLQIIHATEHLKQLINELLSLRLCCLQGQGPLTTLVLLEFLRWLCRSLVAPSWNVFGKAPSNMVNSGVFSSKREIRTICAA